ncbi:MAG: hypothetical protein M3N22_05765 [Acidobacteriota bacterium]|nr:hypothetical protein [Acidobacteriota bacterium]
MIEIVGAPESEIKWVGKQIREINQQASVLVITLSAHAKKITATHSR